MKNLSTTDYADKAAVTDAILQLFTYARTQANNIYSLSIVLIAAALQGVSENYETVLRELKPALILMDDSPEKNWLMGRMLFAEAMIDPRYVYQSSSISQESMTILPYNVMNAWALAYFSSLSPESYVQMRTSMLQAVNDQQTAAILPDALWALIMGLQAAAYANQRSDYDVILQNMKLLTNRQSLTEVFSFLTRTEDSSDYPAWAIGIVCVAAVCMDDKELFDEVSVLLSEAIQAAKSWTEAAGQSPSNQWKGRAEATMGRIYLVLASAQWHLSHDDGLVLDLPVLRAI
jgi:hypothetical protein